MQVTGNEFIVRCSVGADVWQAKISGRGPVCLPSIITNQSAFPAGQPSQTAMSACYGSRPPNLQGRSRRDFRNLGVTCQPVPTVVAPAPGPTAPAPTQAPTAPSPSITPAAAQVTPAPTVPLVAPAPTAPLVANGPAPAPPPPAAPVPASALGIHFPRWK